MDINLTKKEVQDMHNRISKLYSPIYDSIENKMDATEYYELHQNKLTPLAIKINCENFLQELDQYQQYFCQWGLKHTHLPRQGLVLVNQDGILGKENDPANYPGDEWNLLHPDNFLLESDYRVPTPIMDLPSLASLKMFNDHWYRCNILKWGAGAKFYPHFDNGLPAPWLRFWGTTHPENTVIRFWDEQTESMRAEENIEAGRLYLIDTSLVHDGICTNDITYHFFFCLSNSAKDLVKSIT